MILRFTERARRDLAKYFAITEKRSVHKAIADDNRIKEACLILLDFPGMGRAGRIKGTQEFLVTDTPYIIVYRLLDETLQVSRMLHGARQWPSSMPKL